MWSDEMLELAIPTPEKPISIEEQLGLPKGVSIHDLNPVEWYRPMEIRIDVSNLDAEELKRRLGDIYFDGSVLKEDKPVVKFKNGSSIEALPNTSDIIRSTSDFCTGFKGGNTPTSLKMEVVKDRTKTMKDWIDSLTDAWAKLGCTTFRVSPSDVDKLIKKAEEKKMPTKFTFYTEEGYRIDKSNNSKVETITTFVKINGFDNTYLGMATCDKVDYSERDGILNAIANAVLGGNFDREYEKFLADEKRKYDESCKCKICGRNYYEDEKTGKRTPFTPEDARKHEEWHEQNKKNKREKYLIRKEAKRRLAEAEREGKIEQTMKELYKK